MKKIISITNSKGGVGKSTLALNLAKGLSLEGKTVCLFDLDYTQASLTESIFDKFDERDDSPGIIEAFWDRSISITDIVYETQHKGVYCVPTERKLKGRDVILEDILKNDEDRNYILGDILADDFFNEFDYIILDNPPNLGLMVVNSLFCCTHVLIPTLTDDKSTNKIPSIIEKCLMAKKRVNRNLELLGIVFMNTEGREKLTREKRSYFNEMLGDVVFNAEIRKNAAFKSLDSEFKSIFDTKNSRGKADYSVLVEEVISRVEKNKKISRNMEVSNG